MLLRHRDTVAFWDNLGLSKLKMPLPTLFFWPHFCSTYPENQCILIRISGRVHTGVQSGPRPLLAAEGRQVRAVVLPAGEARRAHVQPLRGAGVRRQDGGRQCQLHGNYRVTRRI